MNVNGGMNATNRELIRAIVAERRAKPRNCAYWVASIRDELADTLLDLTALLDEASDMTGEALPPPAEALRSALVGFLASPSLHSPRYRRDP